jgi:large subunit ribosomal protein L32
MAVPKKRTSSRKQGTRRSHLALAEAPTTICQNCGATIKPHNACPKCGFYRGRKILKVA